MWIQVNASRLFEFSQVLLQATTITCQYMHVAQIPTSMPRGTRLFAQNYVRHNGRGNCFLARLLDWHSYKARPFHARFNGAERHRSSSTLQRWLSQPQDAGDQKRSSKSSTLHRQSHQPRKAGLVPQLRCTEFGPMGQVLIANGRLKKTELVTRVSMQLLQSHSVS